MGIWAAYRPNGGKMHPRTFIGNTISNWITFISIRIVAVNLWYIYNSQFRLMRLSKLLTPSTSITLKDAITPRIHHRNLTDMKFVKIASQTFGSLSFRSILRAPKILWFSVVVDVLLFFATKFIKRIRCFRCCVRNVLNLPYQGPLRTTYYENHPNRNGISYIMEENQW